MKLLRSAIPARSICLILAILLGCHSAGAQLNWNEALSKSVFARDDLSTLPSGQILGKRNTLDRLSGVMSVQNCFLVPKTPAHVAGVILNWNPTAYPELGVMLHEKMTVPPALENFTRLAFNPTQPHIKAFLDKCARQSPSGGPLNLSKAESAYLKKSDQGPNSLALTWHNLLLSRALNYQSTGIAQFLPYENGKTKISLPAEIQSLVKEIPGITQHFAALLNLAFNNPSAEKQSETYYWELITVQREGTLILGSMFQLPNSSSNGGIQVSDFQYYVSSSFSSALILYDLIPVTFQGQPATLVWRNDFVFIPSAISGSGIERMATENILLLEVQKSIKRLQKDAS